MWLLQVTQKTAANFLWLTAPLTLGRHHVTEMEIWREVQLESQIQLTSKLAAKMVILTENFG